MCSRCKQTLGIPDDSAEGWRIWKWCIRISPRPGQPSTTFSVQKWISARLLFLVENQGVRKFHVHADVDPSQTEPVPSILLWVFTPDLFYSSSIPTQDRQDPTRSMKVFYQYQTYAPPKPGEPESASIEQVSFVQELYDVLERGLKESQQLLPGSARKFQGWEVGLLERFDTGDVKPVKLETPEADLS